MNNKEITIQFNGQSETYLLSDTPCDYAQAEEFAAQNGMGILPRWRLLEIDPITGKERCRLIDEQIPKGYWVWAEPRDTKTAWLVVLGTSNTNADNRNDYNGSWNGNSNYYYYYYALCGPAFKNEKLLASQTQPVTVTVNLPEAKVTLKKLTREEIIENLYKISSPVSLEAMDVA